MDDTSYNKDIRWVQRFDNFNRAIGQLEYAMNLMQERELFFFILIIFSI